MSAKSSLAIFGRGAASLRASPTIPRAASAAARVCGSWFSWTVKLGRMGAVGAAAGDADVEEIRARHHRPAVHRDLALRAFGGIVERIDLIAREALEQPVGQHGAGTAQPLLGRLEDEHDGAVELAGLG